MTANPRHPATRSIVAVALALLVAGATGACTTKAVTTPPAVSTTTNGPTSAPPSLGPFAGSADAGLSKPQADPLYPDFGNPDLDVLSYQLKLNWAPTTKTLTGFAALLIRPTRAVTNLSLDFTNTYTVDSATVDGVAQTATRHSNDLVVPTGHPLAADSRTTLIVRYHGTPHEIPFPSNRSDASEGLGLRAVANGDAWTMQEPYGASTWYPVNDHPSDEATYDISVTVPTGWAAIANGTPSPATTGADGVTYHYTSTDPVASYVTTLAIGHYTEVTAHTQAGVPISAWLRTRLDDNLLPAVNRLPELLNWLAGRYGPYPFPTAGVVFVNSTSAMETQQMITFGAGPGGGSADTAEISEVLLHEFSHQWFGDSVTPTNWLGLWLNEGWAMYSEWLWSVDQGMRSDANWVALARASDSRSRATAGPPGHPNVGHFAETNVYFGPALMLHAIHHEIGDTKFFAMARDWVQTHRNQSVDRDMFVAFVKQHTGRDFTALINTWLDSPTEPAA